MTVIADPRYFSTWSHGKNAAGTGRSRHDYDCPQHVLAEMLHEEYWQTLLVDIEPGDLIWITDGEAKQALVKIDWKDTASRRAGFSIIERATEHPVIAEDGMAIKNRGPRGGFWSVIGDGGEVLKSGMRTRAEAERERDILKAQPKAAA